MLLDLLFLLLLGKSNHLVDNVVALLLAHAGHGLHAVLHEHFLGGRNQLRQHLVALREFFISFILFIERTYCGRIAALGLVEALLSPIDVAEREHKHSLRCSTARRKGTAFLIGLNGRSRIGKGQVDITHRIVNLVKIILVVRILGHAFELLNLLQVVALRHHFGLTDLGIKLHLVRRTLAHALLIGFVAFLT